tara:strand:- start:2519 stop:2881 length:363 start_codon:yes stop_codon:yes gene_type:complete
MSIKVHNTAPIALGKKRLRGQYIVRATKHPAKKNAHPRSKYQMLSRVVIPNVITIAKNVAVTTGNLLTPRTRAKNKKGTATNIPGLTTASTKVTNKSNVGRSQVLSDKLVESKISCTKKI